MYAARLAVMYVARSGGGGCVGGARPTDCQCSHMEGGGEVSVCMGARRKERGNGKSEKWNKMEEEGDREGEQREKGTEREMYSLFSLPPFFYTYTTQFFQCRLGFSEKPPTEDVDYSATVTYITFRQTEDNDSPHLSHTILTIIII